MAGKSCAECFKMLVNLICKWLPDATIYGWMLATICQSHGIPAANIISGFTTSLRTWKWPHFMVDWSIKQWWFSGLRKLLARHDGPTESPNPPWLQTQSHLHQLLIVSIPLYLHQKKPPTRWCADAKMKHYLVGGCIPTPLKNMSSSIGMIISNIWENNPNVPNHQPVIVG